MKIVAAEEAGDHARKAEPPEVAPHIREGEHHDARRLQLLRYGRERLERVGGHEADTIDHGDIVLTSPIEIEQGTVDQLDVSRPDALSPVFEHFFRQIDT